MPLTLCCVLAYTARNTRKGTWMDDFKLGCEVSPKESIAVQVIGPAGAGIEIPDTGGRGYWKEGVHAICVDPDKSLFFIQRTPRTEPCLAEVVGGRAEWTDKCVVQESIHDYEKVEAVSMALALVKTHPILSTPLGLQSLIDEPEQISTVAQALRALFILAHHQQDLMEEFMRSAMPDWQGDDDDGPVDAAGQPL